MIKQGHTEFSSRSPLAQIWSIKVFSGPKFAGSSCWKGWKFWIRSIPRWQLMCGMKHDRPDALMQRKVYTCLCSTRPVFCNLITPSRSALVYLSTWFLRHGPWITQPPSRVHLTLWHHLSTFIDIRFLHRMENNGKTKTANPRVARILYESILGGASRRARGFIRNWLP